MARIKNDYLVGKVGKTVNTSWKGIPVTKQYQPDVNQPRTPAQVTMWKSFGIISKFCSLNKSIIDLGFQKPGKAFYAMNEARSVNAPKKTITGTWPDITVHYDKICLSAGLIPQPAEVSAHVSENSLNITWKTGEKIKLANPADFVMVVLFYPDEKQEYLKAVHHICVARRKDGAVNIALENKPGKLHAWMFFLNQNLSGAKSEKNVSNSVYLGQF